MDLHVKAETPANFRGLTRDYDSHQDLVLDLL
jgi:hypothetical protein